MAFFARRPPFLRHPLILALVAGVAGFAVNGVGFPIFGGTSIIFGGFFSLLSAFLFGPWLGALTAAIAFTRSVAEWQHPAPLVCFTLEAFVAGWLVHRRGWRELNAIAVYWLALGFPIVAVWMVRFSQVPFPGNWAIALKYPVNGLLMGLAALLASQFAVQRWPLTFPVPAISRPASLRQMLFQRFGSIAALPIAILSFLSGHQFDLARREDVTQDLAEWVDDISEVVSRHIDSHQRVMVTLARELANGGDTSPESLRRELESIRREYAGFRTLLITDAHGRVLAVATPPEVGTTVLSPRELDVSDRDYYRIPLATRKPYVSDVFQGRGLGHDLIVAVSAPVLDQDGRVQFVVEGSLDLTAISRAIAAAHIAEGCDIVIVDRQQRVVAASGSYASIRPLTPFIGNTLYDAARRSGARTFYHDGWNAAHARQERFAAAALVIPQQGWRVYVQLPVWTIQKGIAQFYLTTLLWAAAGIGVALGLAQITATSLTRPLSGLLRATRALSTKNPKPVESQTLDMTGFPTEIAQLSSDVHTVAVHLRQSNLELELLVSERDRTNAQLMELLQTLDAKVAERTSELQDARAAAESANLAKSDFLASMSHELRTPLNVILGMNELLSEQKLGPLNPRQIECLQSVDESGRHLLSLINDILDLSKVEAGKVQLDFQAISVRDVVEASLRMIHEIARKKGIRVSVDYQQQTTSLTADPRRLKQILVNLLSNAVKFTPDDGRVGITVTQTVTPPEIAFTVWDTGIGIAPESLGKLFQPFVQIDSALSRRYSGTGLGLALVKRMIQLHHGAVFVESTPHLGSRFRVSLPLTQAEVEHASVVPAPPLPAATEPPMLIPGSPLILLAEDNAANVALIEQFARMRGCRLVLAATGVEAVARARTDSPDVILMDVNMPEMDGLEATRRIAMDPRTRRIPVICVTAAAMPEDRARCFAAGASAYLSKPVNLQELAATITRLLPTFRHRPVSQPT